MKKPSVVLFDLGNVIVRFLPKLFWEELGLAKLGMNAPYIDAVSSASRHFEKGDVTSDEYFDLLIRIFDGQFSRRRIVDAFASVLTAPVDGMEQIVRRVRKKAGVALVSNTNAFHIRYCMKAIAAMQEFPKMYLSYEMGVMKPDAEFYRTVLKDQRTGASSMLFIDDVQENVDGARRAGMQGLRFSGASELEVSLKKLGLL